ncbi:MAG: Asp-tRNA(Asn)/Glu-tRNA(Gln) amidotransferase subunit GatA [Bacteroidia bacterium]|nr:Asp-tRNA(Asn)/Glu-tRNA(Gln) amidotransferase subunit GatA [Bacteroidia bacterium]
MLPKAIRKIIRRRKTAEFLPLIVNYTSYTEIRPAILSGNISVTRIVEHFLGEINSHRGLNAFLEVFTDSALATSRRLDSELKEGKSGRLTGMVIAIKDNIAYAGHRVSCASRILEGYVSPYTATALQRLIQEGAVVIGRTNCDEFAMGSSNENSAFGPVKNPHDVSRVPGGSSGGSAAAVAAGLCMVALGSDTGGSIRQPASFCGVVGYKPTYGRVSRYGLLAYASSFDQIGPLSRNVSDAVLAMEIMAGKDEMDATSLSRPFHLKKEKYNGEKVRAAYLKDCLEHPALDPEVKKNTLAVIESLRKAGHTVEGVDFPYIDYLVPAYYVLTTAEASSNLSRYDGVHFGYRSHAATDLESTYRLSRSEGFGDEVKRRIMLGTFVLSAGYYDAYYSKAQKVRQVLRKKTNDIFSNYHLILSPTTPGAAFRHGEISDPIKMYLEDIFTVLANESGCPAISLPLCTLPGGLPAGTQFMAPQGKDEWLLTFAEHLVPL